MNPKREGSTRKWFRAELDEVLSERTQGEDALEHEVGELRPWFLPSVETAPAAEHAEALD